jgi:hypothetical protein
MKKMLLAIALGILTASGTALAHHGGNLYDTTKTVELKGTITKFEWGTPHNQIYFDVKTDKGEVQHWVGSTEPAGVMLERGWTRKSLALRRHGDRVSSLRERTARPSATCRRL